VSPTSKTSGLGAKVTVNSNDISNDITDFTLSTPRAVQDITGIDKSAHERLLLLADASVSLKGVFNNASSESHQTLSGMGSSALTTVITPTSSSTPNISMSLMYSDYTVTRAAGGELTFDAKGDLADGTSPSWTNS
jgi:hypothetical protein